MSEAHISLDDRPAGARSRSRDESDIHPEFASQSAGKGRRRLSPNSPRQYCLVSCCTGCSFDVRARHGTAWSAARQRGEVHSESFGQVAHEWSFDQCGWGWDL